MSHVTLRAIDPIIWAATFGAAFASCEKAAEAAEIADDAVRELGRLTYPKTERQDVPASGHGAIPDERDAAPATVHITFKNCRFTGSEDDLRTAITKMWESAAASGPEPAG